MVTRAVLAYVADKQAALQEFHRILKPGGRISSPHPWAPPVAQILAEQFTTEEREFFEKMVRPTVESGKNISTERTVYLQAARPVD